MRKILVILAVVLLIVLGAGVWVVYNANSLIAGYKPQLESLLSSALKTSVSLGEIEAEIFPALQLSTSNFRLGGDQAAGADALRLGKVSLAVELAPLLSGQINATELTIDSPRITVVKNDQGISIVGLPKSEKASAESTSQPAREQSSKAAPAAALPPGLALNLQRLSLQGGEIIFQDQTQNKNYSVKELNLDAKIALQGSTLKISEAKLSANVLEQYDLSILAQGSSFDIDQGALEIGAAQVVSPFGKAELKGSYKLKQQQASLDLRLIDLHHKTDQLTLQGGAGDIALAIDKSSQRFATRNLRAQLNNEELKLALSGLLTDKQLEVRDVKFNGFGGELTGLANYSLGSQEFDFEMAAANFDVGRALGALKPGAVPFKGTLEKGAAKLRGKSGTSAMESLSGTAKLLLKDGELSGVNFAGTVLKAVKDIPLVSGALYSRVPAEYADEVNAQRTPIKEFSADFEIGQARLSTSNLKLLSTIFSLDAAGRVGFDLNLDLKSTIYFAPPFSQALTHGVKELSVLLDQEKRLVLPLKVEGKVPAIVVLPDLSKLLKRGAESLIRDKAGDLLNRALGGSGKEQGGKGGIGGVLGF